MPELLLCVSLFGGHFYCLLDLICHLCLYNIIVGNGLCAGYVMTCWGLFNLYGKFQFEYEQLPFIYKYSQIERKFIK